MAPQRGHTPAAPLLLAALLLACALGGASGVLRTEPARHAHSRPSALRQTAALKHPRRAGDNIVMMLANKTATSDFAGTMTSCAIEAAGRLGMESKSVVQVLATFADEWHAKDAFHSLPIQYLEINESALFHGTPMQKWYDSGAWKQSYIPYYDFTDAGRLAAVFKLGGLYLDTDVIPVSPRIMDMPVFLARQDWYVVNPHTFRFPVGHHLLWRWMEAWTEVCGHDGSGKNTGKDSVTVYGRCGPNVITQLYYNECREKCGDATCSRPGGPTGVPYCPDALPPEVTVPFGWEEAVNLTQPGTAQLWRDKREGLLALHWYQTPITNWTGQFCFHDSSFLFEVASASCPMTLQRHYDLLVCPPPAATGATEEGEEGGDGAAGSAAAARGGRASVVSDGAAGGFRLDGADDEEDDDGDEGEAFGAARGGGRAGHVPRAGGRSVDEEEVEAAEEEEGQSSGQSASTSSGDDGEFGFDFDTVDTRGGQQRGGQGNDEPQAQAYGQGRPRADAAGLQGGGEEEGGEEGDGDSFDDGFDAPLRPRQQQQQHQRARGGAVATGRNAGKRGGAGNALTSQRQEQPYGAAELQQQQQEAGAAEGQRQGDDGEGGEGDGGPPRFMEDLDEPFRR